MVPDRPVESTGGDPVEPINFSFIIKIWIDQIASEGNPMIWRGRITHVPSGDQRAIQQIDDIIAFITAYLNPIGQQAPARRSAWQRLGGWLRRCRAEQ
jgi:hypothetical protein